MLLIQSRFFIFLLLFVALGQELELEAKRPNILLIVSEDNGPELGCYGDPYVQTPVLDLLSAQGVRFNRAYVPQAGCSQSRAALLTGLYPHQNGQIGLATWKFRLYDAKTPNLVRSLKEGGYRTGIIGKLHINPASAFPFDFKKIPSGNFSRSKLGDYAKAANEFITESNAPFFLSVNYPDAHRPFINKISGIPKQTLKGKDVKPLSYFGIDTLELREQTASYYNCMSRLDSLIDDLLDVLKKSGKWDETLIIYLGDHGGDMLRGKRTSYEGGVRIPLIMHWKGKVGFSEGRGQGVRDELVSTLDLMPTILNVAGVAQPDGLSGKSLLPLLQGRAKSWREYLFTEYHTHSAHNFFPQRTVRNGRFKLIQNLQPNQINPGYDFTMNRFFPGLQKVIDQTEEPVRSAYALTKQPPELELYDLKSDPFEFRNLANDETYASHLNLLKQNLEKWRKETNDPFLDPKNLKRLKSEINECFDDFQPSKKDLKLNYWNYFFE